MQNDLVHQSSQFRRACNRLRRCGVICTRIIHHLSHYVLSVFYEVEHNKNNQIVRMDILVLIHDWPLDRIYSEQRVNKKGKKHFQHFPFQRKVGPDSGRLIWNQIRGGESLFLSQTDCLSGGCSDLDTDWYCFQYYCPNSHTENTQNNEDYDKHFLLPDVTDDIYVV